MVEQFFAIKQITGGTNSTLLSTMTLLSGPPSWYVAQQCSSSLSLFPFHLNSIQSFPGTSFLANKIPSGKTSLLFQFAINYASETCGSVVFLCGKPKLESKPPFLSQGIDPSSDAFQRIQMKYLEDDNGIKKYFAAFHLQESFPVAVIIDDFGDFFSDKNCQDRYGNARGKDLAMVRTLALCQDAIGYANTKLHSSGSCKLLLADSHQGDNPRLLFIYKRWIHCIFTIQGDGRGSFYLKGSSIAGNRSESARTAKYSIALNYLQLEEIVD